MFEGTNPPPAPMLSFIFKFVIGLIMVIGFLALIVYAKYGISGFKNAYYTVKNRYTKKPEMVQMSRISIPEQDENRLYDAESS